MGYPWYIMILPYILYLSFYLVSFCIFFRWCQQWTFRYPESKQKLERREERREKEWKRTQQERNRKREKEWKRKFRRGAERKRKKREEERKRNKMQVKEGQDQVKKGKGIVYFFLVLLAPPYFLSLPQNHLLYHSQAIERVFPLFWLLPYLLCPKLRLTQPTILATQQIGE